MRSPSEAQPVELRPTRVAVLGECDPKVSGGGDWEGVTPNPQSSVQMEGYILS